MEIYHFNLNENLEDPVNPACPAKFENSAAHLAWDKQKNIK
jgi:hypothetical protein